MISVVKKMLCLGLLNAICFPVFAQIKKAPKKELHTLPKFPVFTTYLGQQKSGTISLEEGKQLLDSALTAKDQMKKTYKITAFDFGYLHTDTTFNDTTEQFKLIHDYFGYTFHSNQLDSLWRTRIAAELQPGEKLYYDNIVAEDSDGKKYRTPPVHLVIRQNNE